jgi:hypothetical protein
MYASVNDPKIMKAVGVKKPPGFLCEAAFVSVSLLLAKLWSDPAFSALSFTSVLLPIMLYFILAICFNILKFLKLLHTEDLDEDAGILSPKQTKLLFTVARNLFGYFGVYTLAGQLDLHVIQKDLAGQSMGPAIAAIQLAFLIQMMANYQKRKAHAIATGQEGGVGFLGATGLTTIFNALTQTTTTLCANGQCFTIYSNTISSNLAAFGCSVTSINTYLIPLCCMMLTYALWNVYKTRRDCTYKPFLISLLGASLIVLDNFLFGEQLQMHNIPSWIGNALLIIGVIWSSRDSAKEQASPFDF